MKKLTLITLLSLTAPSIQAQTSLSGQIGISGITAVPSFFSNNNGSSLSGETTPAVSATYIWKQQEPVSIGIEAGYTGCSFTESYTAHGGAGYYGSQIIFKSNYLSLSPIADLSMGKDWHALLGLSIDLLLRAKEDYRQYENVMNAPLAITYDSTINAHNDVSKVNGRIGLEIIKEFPLDEKKGNNRVTIGAGFSLLFNNITNTTDGNLQNRKPGYIYLQAGFKHRYHKKKEQKTN